MEIINNISMNEGSQVAVAVHYVGIYLTIYTDVPCDLGLGFLLVARGVYMNIYSALGSAGTSFF